MSHNINIISWYSDLGHTFGIIKDPAGLDMPPTCFVDAADIDLDDDIHDTIKASCNTSNKRFSDQMLWLAHMESTTTAVRRVETKHEKDKFINDMTNFLHRGRYGIDFDRMAQSWNSEVLAQEKANISEGTLHIII